MVLRAGLIGLGMMGRNHARILQSTEGVELVGVCDPIGDKFGAVQSAKIVPGVEELIELGLDLCVVACPTEDHESVGLTLAEAGVHTLMEKPLAVDSAAAFRVYEAFDSRGLVGAVGHIERSNAAVREMRQRLRDGILGEVFQVSTRRVGPFPARIRDVGVVKDLATHDLDLAAWIGGSEYSEIAARTVFRSGRANEDLVAATGVLANGIVTNHLVNWLSPVKERLIVATGDKGNLIADTLLSDLTFCENGVGQTSWETVSQFRGVSEGNIIRYAIDKPEPLRTQFENFRDAVLGKGDEIVTMKDGLGAVAAADACITSAATGKTVSIQLGETT